MNTATALFITLIIFVILCILALLPFILCLCIGYPLHRWLGGKMSLIQYARHIEKIIY